ncbi:hypothetical protein [Nocardioides sp. B-3]|uniref:hypothetical protein n=1 Tax=Nocardioides sp. B-3 TaxID=2895565 RepID=UPI002152AC16|nr:hypothetical protein [Nocardioides sp. B-3]UUZ59129.1 hypothetical protein LP418_24870 [Nocardioides sp. B-3]
MTHTARRRLLVGCAVIVVVALVALALRGPSPEDPGEGEMTAVVVAVRDQPVIGGERVATHYSVAVVLTEQAMFDAYAASLARERAAEAIPIWVLRPQTP